MLIDLQILMVGDERRGKAERRITEQVMRLKFIHRDLKQIILGKKEVKPLIGQA